MQVPSRNITKFLILQQEISIFLKIRNFFRMGHFIFQTWKVPSFSSCLWKCIKIYWLNIIKNIEKDDEKNLVKDIKILLQKKKIWKYDRKRYKNLSEDEKNTLVQYKKGIINEKKHLIIILWKYYNLKKLYFIITESMRDILLFLYLKSSLLTKNMKKIKWSQFLLFSICKFPTEI